MAEILPGLLNLREQLNDQQKHTFTNIEAYLIAFVIAIISVVIYSLIQGRDEFRYSTALTIGSIVFLITLNILDYPDKRWFQLVTIIIIAGVILEVVGYEVLRVMKQRNLQISLAQITD